jgi:hypothetical protein
LTSMLNASRFSTLSARDPMTYDASTTRISAARRASVGSPHCPRRNRGSAWQTRPGLRVAGFRADRARLILAMQIK